VRFCADLLDVPAVDVSAAFEEIENSELLTSLKQRYAEIRPDSAGLELGRFRMWWAVVRLTRPEVVIETGVHDGLSSSILLGALDRNGAGRLISVDLPSTDLPGNASGPGWLVPEHLRARWDLRLGDARKLLPAAVADAGRVDVFIHDSDHSEQHQSFEYAAVAPGLTPGAVVLSDQDYPMETTLSAFAESHGGRHLRVKSVAGDPGLWAGGVRMPVS
jgi:predicted O-methyltransferase YrrM